MSLGVGGTRVKNLTSINFITHKTIEIHTEKREGVGYGFGYTGYKLVGGYNEGKGTRKD